MRFKTGIAVEELNGSAGGTTAARNKSRAYFKMRTAPRNPRTESQMKARASLAGLSKSWGKLTDEQRRAWDEFAKSQKGRRVLGVAGILSGFNAFCRIQINAKLIDVVAPLNPPSNLLIGELVSINVSAVSATDFEVTASMLLPNVAATQGISTAVGRLVIEATPILPDGRAGNPSALRVIGIGGAGTSSGTAGSVVELRGLQIASAYTEKFGETLTAGMKVQFAAKFVSTEADQTGISTLKIMSTEILPKFVPAG